MNYDIIIATKNRLSMLKISLPLFINQTIKAISIIIVDSSDDHNSVKEYCESIRKKMNTGAQLTVVKSRVGAAYQRNIGMESSTSEVIFFPDDDSLWYPDYAENIIKIYEIDQGLTIGGIQGMSVGSPPDVSSGKKSDLQQVRLKEKFSVQLIRLKKKTSLNLFEDPIFIEGHARQKLLKFPDWLASDIAVPGGPMTGFAMSFKADLIKRIRFDENLGDYSLFEDRDASLGVMKEKLIFVAKRAKVYHYRAPERRSSGREWGVMHILNRAYVVCKHSESTSKSRRTLKLYLLYKLFRYLLQATNRYGVQRLNGAISAYRQVGKLINSNKDELSTVYVAAKNCCLKVFC